MSFDITADPFTVMVDQLAAPTAGKRRGGKHARIRIGEQFGHWTVMDYIPGTRLPGKRVNAHALCRCDCGCLREVAVWNLYLGKSQSCGHAGRGRPPIKDGGQRHEG